ncbi:MAG: GNAT family N-acetyltransferase [Verrucomicrobiota bacterium]
MSTEAQPILSLRPASLADRAIIRQLAHEIWPLCYGPLLPKGQVAYMLAGRYEDSALALLFEEREYFLLILDHDPSPPTPIGFCSLRLQVPEARLEELYLDPAHQGKGLGSRALQLLEAHCQEGNATRISLRVNRANEPAIQCYRRNGFDVLREEVTDIGRGFVMDDFWMGKPLDQTKKHTHAYWIAHQIVAGIKRFFFTLPPFLLLHVFLSVGTWVHHLLFALLIGFLLEMGMKRVLYGADV